MADGPVKGHTGACPQLVRQRQLMDRIVQIGLPCVIVMGDEVPPGPTLSDDHVSGGHGLDDAGDLLTLLDAVIGHVGGIIAKLHMRPGVGLRISCILYAVAAEPEGHIEISLQLRFVGTLPG